MRPVLQGLDWEPCARDGTRPGLQQGATGLGEREAIAAAEGCLR
jgi:hypothetical protein